MNQIDTQLMERLQMASLFSGSPSPSSSSIMSFPSQYSPDDQFSISYSTDASSIELNRTEPPRIEELFPVDTEKQIYEDIEKLFKDGEETGKSASSNSKTRFEKGDFPMDESSRFYYILNEIIADNVKNISVVCQIQLCSSELVELQVVLASQLVGHNEAKSYSDNFSDFFWKNLSPNMLNQKIVISSHTGSTTSMELNDLLFFIWNHLSIYEKLEEFIRVKGTVISTFPSTENQSESEKLLLAVKQTIKEWYLIVVSLKNKMIVTNTLSEVEMTAPGIRKEDLEQLWTLTRRLRTLLWLHSLKSSSPLNSQPTNSRLKSAGFTFSPKVFNQTQ